MITQKLNHTGAEIDKAIEDVKAHESKLNAHDTKIAGLGRGLEEKQPKEPGKGLSEANYTNEEKTKVTNAVLNTAQEMTPEQQKQARENIQVLGKSEVKSDLILNTDASQRVTSFMPDAESDLVYTAAWGGKLTAFSISQNKEIWTTTCFQSAYKGNDKFIVIKGNYLYTISKSQGGRFCKLDKLTGEILLQKEIPSNLYLYDSSINLFETSIGILVSFSNTISSLYLLNEENLSVTEMEICKGKIKLVDFTNSGGVIYTTDKEVVIYGSDMQEYKRYTLTSTKISEIKSLLWIGTSGPVNQFSYAHWLQGELNRNDNEKTFYYALSMLGNYQYSDKWTRIVARAGVIKYMLDESSIITSTGTKVSAHGGIIEDTMVGGDGHIDEHLQIRRVKGVTYAAKKVGKKLIVKQLL